VSIYELTGHLKGCEPSWSWSHCSWIYNSTE